jgi:cysteine desulfurase
LEGFIETETDDTVIVGKKADRLPNTSCFAVPGWKSEVQVMQMDLAGFSISAGSACSSGKVKKSKVLEAMGYSEEVNKCAVRVSLGLQTNIKDIEKFFHSWNSSRKFFQARVT